MTKKDAKKDVKSKARTAVKKVVKVEIANPKLFKVGDKVILKDSKFHAIVEILDIKDDGPAHPQPLIKVQGVVPDEAQPAWWSADWFRKATPEEITGMNHALGHQAFKVGDKVKFVEGVVPASSETSKIVWTIQKFNRENGSVSISSNGPPAQLYTKVRDLRRATLEDLVNADPKRPFKSSLDGKKSGWSMMSHGHCVVCNEVTVLDTDTELCEVCFTRMSNEDILEAEDTLSKWKRDIRHEPEKTGEIAKALGPRTLSCGPGAAFKPGDKVVSLISTDKSVGTVLYERAEGHHDNFFVQWLDTNQVVSSREIRLATPEESVAMAPSIDRQFPWCAGCVRSSHNAHCAKALYKYATNEKPECIDGDKFESKNPATVGSAVHFDRLKPGMFVRSPSGLNKGVTFYGVVNAITAKTGIVWGSWENTPEEALKKAKSRNVWIDNDNNRVFEVLHPDFKAPITPVPTTQPEPVKVTVTKPIEYMYVITDGDGDISMDGPYNTVKDAVSGAKDELDGSSGDPEDTEVLIVTVAKKLKTKMTLEDD